MDELRFNPLTGGECQLDKTNADVIVSAVTRNLEESLETVPKELAPWGLDLSAGGSQLTYTYDPHTTHTGISDLLQAIQAAGLSLKDLNTTQTSLEEIFVNLVNESS